jgi:hypothetical protein
MHWHNPHYFQNSILKFVLFIGTLKISDKVYWLGVMYRHSLILDPESYRVKMCSLTGAHWIPFHSYTNWDIRFLNYIIIFYPYSCTDYTVTSLPYWNFPKFISWVTENSSYMIFITFCTKYHRVRKMCSLTGIKPGIIRIVYYMYV